MDDNQRTAVVVGLALVGLSVFSGLLFVLFVMTEGEPTSSDVPAAEVREP